MDRFDETTAAATIVAAIIAEGAAEAYMSASEEQRTEMMLAYMQGQARKIEKLQTLYMTNDNFREAFRQSVYELCQTN